MKFKEFYSKKNISPRLEKILKENIVKAIEYSYKSVLSEGRWSPKGEKASRGVIDSWTDTINLDDEEIKDALVSTLGGREEVADKAIASGDSAIDKIENLLFKAKKDGDNDAVETYRVALKSILMLTDSPKAEKTAKKHPELEKVEVDPAKVEKPKSTDKGSDDATKAEDIATSAAEATKEIDKTEEKKAETPEEKATEKTLEELFGELNNEISKIEKNRNIGEAIVQLAGINDKLTAAHKKFTGMIPEQMKALFKRIEDVSLKFKKKSESGKGKGKEDVLSDKPKEEVKPATPSPKPSEPKKEEVTSKKKTEKTDYPLKSESVENSSDKELLEESVWDLFSNFFGSNAGQKAVAAEELIDQHSAEMADMLMNFYIKNPKTLLVVFEALGSITDSKLKQQMAQYMYYMFLMHQGKEKKWFKKDATDLLNKYSSDSDIDAGIKKAQSVLKAAKIIP